MIAKIFSVKHSEDLVGSINYLNDIYRVNMASKDKGRLRYFDSYARYTEIVFKCGTFLYLLSTLSYFLNPLYIYWYKQELVTLLPTYVPGIDENSVKGYVILTFYHILLMGLAFIASVAIDFLYTMIIVNTPILAILIEFQVKQLNEFLVETPNDLSMIKFKLRNILLMHREMTE